MVMNASGKRQGTRIAGILSVRLGKNIAFIVFAVFFLGYIFAGCGGEENNPGNNSNESTPEVAEDTPEPLPEKLSEAIEKRAELGKDAAFAKFSHGSDYHARLPCLLCHKRETNAARISLPGRRNHTPCAGCHTLQFENKESAICTICHTDVDTGAMKRFPRMRSFGARFVHSKHQRTNCSRCHKPTRRGAAFSIPNRMNAHQTCFQCHTSRSGNRMASCSLCHKGGAGRMRRPFGARAFRAGFSHRKHVTGQKLDCDTCHTVRPSRSARRQVVSPMTAMHFAPEGAMSCASCHNDEIAFGTESFSSCKKCHQSGSFKF